MRLLVHDDCLPGRSLGLLIVPVRKPRPSGLVTRQQMSGVSGSLTYEYAAMVTPSSFAVAMTVLHVIPMALRTK